MTTPIKSSLPLAMDAMEALLADSTTRLQIDYDNSRIQNRAALIYLTNLNLKNIEFQTTDKEKTFALIDAYITQKSALMVECLLASIVTILFRIKEITPNQVDEAAISKLSLISSEDVEAYLQDRSRMLNVLKLIHLLDNIPTFIYTCSKQFRDQERKPEECFPVINSLDYSGYTFVNLMVNEMFCVHYYSKPIKTDVVYFQQQFNEYVYGGKNLFYWMSQGYLIPAVDMVDRGLFDKDRLDRMVKEIEGEKS